MNTMITHLTTSGNSTAVRLPKKLLAISGLGSRVSLEARDGKIIISQPNHPRAGWAEAIMREMSDDVDEFAVRDGLDELPWD